MKDACFKQDDSSDIVFHNEKLPINGNSKANKNNWRRQLLSLYFIGVKPPWILRIFIRKYNLREKT